MKSLLLSLLAIATPAGAAEVMVGAAGGVVVMDPLETLDTTWTVNARVDYFFDTPLAIELESGFLQGTTRIGDHKYTALTPRLNLVGRLWNEGRRQEDGTIGKPPFIRPLLVGGLGGFYKNTQDCDLEGLPSCEEGGALGDGYKRKDIDFMVNAGPGLLIPIGKTLNFRTDLRWLVNLGTESFRLQGDRFIDWEWTAGLALSFGGPKDSDKDGILDADDLCPDEAEDKDGFEDANGCPDLDNDGDGISDTEEGTTAEGESCANLPEDMDGFEDANGCPDPDNDDDGILDADDVCPEVAGAATAKGCPDEDGDGIVDEEDECVDERGEKESFGCPDEDEDRVPDYRDVCPDDPAPEGADPLRNNGCPAKVFITADAIKILDKVYFDVGRATIKRKSNELLDVIVETLTAHPEIKKVQIEGHTDNTGDPEKNMVLSEDRAKAVVAYLVEKGVEESHLVAKGFGQEKPLVDGEAADTEEGRAQNRRVEFNIVEQEEIKVEMTRERLTIEEISIDLDREDVKITKAVVPKMTTIEDGSLCKVVLRIDGEGEVDGLGMDGETCVAMARSATRRAVKMWTFEPMKDEAGEVVSFLVPLSIRFEEGKATATVEEKSIKPVPKPGQ